MKNTTPCARLAALLRGTWLTLDDRLFRQPDLVALDRGWEVHRPAPFRRVYRDPRWHSIVACDDCQGIGRDAARPCTSCDGRGTVRLADAYIDAAVVG